MKNKQMFSVIRNKSTWVSGVELILNSILTLRKPTWKNRISRIWTWSCSPPWKLCFFFLIISFALGVVNHRSNKSDVKRGEFFYDSRDSSFVFSTEWDLPPTSALICMNPVTSTLKKKKRMKKGGWLKRTISRNTRASRVWFMVGLVSEDHISVWTVQQFLLQIHEKRRQSCFTTSQVLKKSHSKKNSIKLGTLRSERSLILLEQL